MGKQKRYYWLKMPKNFFDRHDTKLIKKRLGPEALLCYTHLVTESIDHEGQLRFSEDIPYSLDDLADICGTDLEIVEKLFDLLKSKKLIEIWDDGTVYIPFTAGRIGSESESAERVRKYREKKKVLQSNDNVTNSNTQVTKCNTELEKELEKELESDNNINSNNSMSEKSKKKSNDKKPDPSFDEKSEQFVLSDYLRHCILNNNPTAKVPNDKDLQKWAYEVDKMMRLDHRTYNQIETNIMKCQYDDFWKKNILSMKKLREKFDTITLLKTKVDAWNT